MSTDATTGEDLHADQHEDAYEDVHEDARAEPQFDAPPSANAADESTPAAMDEQATPHIEPMNEPTEESASGPPSGAVSESDSTAVEADEAVRSASPLEIALSEVATAETPAPETASDELASEPDTEPVALTDEELSRGEAQEAPTPDERTEEGMPQIAGDGHADGSAAGGELKATTPPELVEPPADEVPAELDLSDQPTEVALTAADLAYGAGPEGADAPGALSEAPTLPDPAYVPPAMHDDAQAEPWMVPAVSPDYVPAAMEAGTDASAQAGPSPSTQYSPADYPHVVYPLPAQRRSRLPLVGVLAAVILAALVVGLLAHNAVTVAQPSASSTLYSSAMTTSSALWPNDKECFFRKDGYHIAGASNCYYSGAEYQDATVTATAKVLSGPTDAAYGIAFRRPGPNNFYIFLVTDNGQWFLVKDNSVLQRAVSNSAIKTGIGATNVLTVRMQGTHFTFFANGTQLGELTDDTYSTGYIGLAGDVNTEVVYRNVSITHP